MKRSGVVVPVRVGRYTLYGEIGSGGMATVHLGHAPSDDHSGVVAIKRLRPHFVSDPDVVKSFLDEARLSSSIRHPSVVDMREVVTRDDEVFLVMEYLEGVPLAALTSSAGGASARLVPPDVLVSILASALHGLHAAHEAVSESGEPLNIVHRDVSPQNILVGVDGRARVLDFGIAKAIGREQSTRDNRIKGKLGYMAPEQLSGRAVTRRTDVFAAGIVLWEHLAGERLFRADSEAATVTRVLMEPVRAPSLVNGASPAPLDAIVLRALERDPSKRFLTAEDMARALERALPPASPEAVGAWVRAIGASDLERRARLVRDVETHASTGAWSQSPATDADAAGVPQPTASITRREPRPRRGLPVAAGLAALAGLVAIGGTLVARTRDKPSTPASAITITAPSVPSADTPALTPPDPSSIASAAPAAPPDVASPSSPSTISSPPSSKGNARHVAKPAGSARQHLYSRD